MRVDFVKAVEPILREDPRSMFITGDLGYNALEKIAAENGRRFVNAGVAEQNMMGVAAGIALTGYKPWIYSIAPFVTYRVFEQIRNDVCLHRLPVRIVGNGGGYTYGIMGSTHHALEDLGALKTLPNMQLFFPCANDHVAAAVKLMHGLADPSYLRLSISAYGNDRPPLSENPKTLTRRYAQGSRLTLVGVGHATQILTMALAKHDLAALDVDVFGIARFPFDLTSDRELVDSARRTRRVLVVDEHYRAGSIAESLALALPAAEAFEALTAEYRPDQKYGSPGFHAKQSGLTPEKVVARAKGMLAHG
jgi:transketolase